MQVDLKLVRAGLWAYTSWCGIMLTQIGMFGPSFWTLLCLFFVAFPLSGYVAKRATGINPYSIVLKRL
jgi:hypothetical protein